MNALLSFGLFSSNDIGPFRAIEESIVAQLTLSTSRSDIYAWYSLVGAAGTAVGAMTCGWTIHFLTENLSWERPDAHRSIFVGYSILGAMKLVLVLSLSRAVEVDEKHTPVPVAATGETAPLLAERSEPEQPKPKSRSWTLLPGIARESLPVIIPLCLLFSLDAFASGQANMYCNPSKYILCQS